jgi:hypothetical protein
MDRQVAVFLYSIESISSFTLSAVPDGSRDVGLQRDARQPRQMDYNA